MPTQGGGPWSGLEQADAHVLGLIDGAPVGLQPAIRDAEDELRLEHAFEIDAILDQLDARQHLIGEFYLADAERPSAARLAEPAEEETGQLPQRIEAEAAGHDRIALEVTGEEPEVRLHRQRRTHMPLAVRAAVLGNLGDPIAHQHRRQWKLRIP